MTTTAPSPELAPAQYTTPDDCTCCDCPTCEQMFWASPRGAGENPTCPACGEIGGRIECQGCLADGIPYSETLPWRPCTVVALTPSGEGAKTQEVCMAPGNWCQHG